MPVGSTKHLLRPLPRYAPTTAHAAAQADKSAPHSQAEKPASQCSTAGSLPVSCWMWRSAATHLWRRWNTREGLTDAKNLLSSSSFGRTNPTY